MFGRFILVLILASRIVPTVTQDACGNRNQYVTQMVLVKQAVHVKSFVPENTTISIRSDFSLAVRNAPTHLDFTTTHTRTHSTVHTVYEKASMSVSVVSDRPATPSDFPAELVDTSAVFALEINIGERDRRRQLPSRQLPKTPGYVGFDGLATTACSNASTYSLQNGQLIVQFANGSIEGYSTSGTVPYQAFIPSVFNLGISQTFSLSPSGILLWTNALFGNGNALFCVIADGTIYAVFVYGLQPPGCIFIDLTISDCGFSVEAMFLWVW